MITVFRAGEPLASRLLPQASALLAWKGAVRVHFPNISMPCARNDHCYDTISAQSTPRKIPDDIFSKALLRWLPGGSGWRRHHAELALCLYSLSRLPPEDRIRGLLVEYFRNCDKILVDQGLEGPIEFKPCNVDMSFYRRYVKIAESICRNMTRMPELKIASDTFDQQMKREVDPSDYLWGEKFHPTRQIIKNAVLDCLKKVI